MSDLDLTVVVDGVARARWERAAPSKFTWDVVPAGIKHKVREQVLPDVIAAAPLIEAQVRERVAQEIEARVPSGHPVYGYRDGLTYAAQIARGAS